MVHRPHTVVFDVVETLISLEPLRARFVEIGLPGAILEGWFDRMLRDGMALTLAGDYEPFPAVAAAALRVIGGGRLGDEQVAHVLDGFATLPAQSDAEPAMRALAEAGMSVVCLSNGARESTEAFLDRSGLDRLVDQVISVAEVRMWKPPRAVYDHALAAPPRTSRWWRCTPSTATGPTPRGGRPAGPAGWRSTTPRSSRGPTSSVRTWSRSRAGWSPCPISNRV